MPNMKVSVSGLDKLTLNGQFLFPTDANATISSITMFYPDGSSSSGEPRTAQRASPANTGEPRMALLRFVSEKHHEKWVRDASFRLAAIFRTEPNTVDEPYPFIGTPVKITDAGTMSFGGSTFDP